MEEIRRRMMQDASLYPDQRKLTKPTRSTSPISIGSTDSSPAVTAAPITKARAIVISSDEEDENPIVRPAASSKPAPAQSSQASNNKTPYTNNVPLTTRPPNFPIPQPYQQSSQAARAPRFPVADPYRPTRPQATQATVPGTNSQPKAIHIPANKDLQFAAPSNPPFTNANANANPNWEFFTLPEERHLYDPQTSAAEAEKALLQLVESAHNDEGDGEFGTEIDMALATVEGFRDEIKLLPHQILGRKWMKERETGKKLGGILADDMGLGKTIQTLTRIVDGRPKKSDKADGWAASTLVVCPVALVSQWAAEIQKMAIGLTVIEHHGPNRTTDPAKLKKAHVVVTSYSVLASEHGAYVPDAKDEGSSKSKSKSKSSKKQISSDSDDDGSSKDSDDSEAFGRTLAAKKKPVVRKKPTKDALFHVKWWRIVLDEAHNIKNRNTKAALACCDLEGKYRWCLTGTPMQNSVEELFSLLKFLQIRPLNDWQEFNEQIAKPVKAGRQVRAMKRLHVVLKAIMLRRKKDHRINGKQIIELPARTVEVVECEFDADERAFYGELETKMSSEVDKLMNAGDAQKNYTNILVMLLRLRQACNHPSLVTKDSKVDQEAIESKAASKGDEADDEADDLAAMFGGLGVSNTRRCQVCQTVLAPTISGTHCSDCVILADKARRKSMARSASDLPPDSAKIRKIMELLEQIDERDEEEKTIIFSQFTSMLNLIQPFLNDRGIQHVRYDGSMAKDKREASLETIRNSKSVRVILISFKAGSTGLNLTACNNVILVDLWWNPALEEQAFDRAHRYGQLKDVNIFKLTIEKTVEDRILALQEKKRELTKAALSGDRMKNNKLGINDLMALFKPGRDDDEE